MRILLRGGTAAEWSTANPTLANREVGVETDTHKIKVGDGTTAWNSLAYLSAALTGVLDDLSDVVITTAASGNILRHNGTNWVNTPGTTHFEVAGAVAAHEADTTSVHGIADTSTLYRSGGTDVAVADGGTGASDAATARTNLGVDYTTLDERTRDAIGTALVAGSNITITPNDGADTITIAATAGSVAADSIFDAKGDLIVGTADNTAAKLTVGSAGAFLVPNSNQSTGLQWVGPLFPVPATGEYMGCQFATGNAGFSTASTLNRVEYCPIWIPARGTFDRIAFFLQTVGSAGAVARLGIYASTSTGKPGTRVLDAGTVATDSGTGTKEITISQALDPGLYWLAFVSQTATCTPRNITTFWNGYMPFQTSGTLPIGNPVADFWIETGVSGALPATATPVSTAAAVNRGPFSVGLRAA